MARPVHLTVVCCTCCMFVRTLSLTQLIYRVSRGNVPYFERMFRTLKYTDITQNTYVYPKLDGYGDNGEISLKV